MPPRNSNMCVSITFTNGKATDRCTTLTEASLSSERLDKFSQGFSFLLPESQCGFRKERGTTDMMFAARQLQKKCQEQNFDLYTTFVDLTKAFDTVSRDGLWKIMSKFGCPDKFIQVVRQFHDGMQAQVLDDRESSTPFPITNGVKQGCVLAPTLIKRTEDRDKWSP